MCENLGLGDKIILNSFDAYVLEYIYKTYEQDLIDADPDLHNIYINFLIYAYNN